MTPSMPDQHSQCGATAVYLQRQMGDPDSRLVSQPDLRDGGWRACTAAAPLVNPGAAAGAVVDYDIVFHAPRCDAWAT